VYFRKLFILICLGVLATLAEVSAVEFPQNKFFTINSETFFFGSEERGGKEEAIRIMARQALSSKAKHSIEMSIELRTITLKKICPVMVYI